MWLTPWNTQWYGAICIHIITLETRSNWTRQLSNNQPHYPWRHDSIQNYHEKNKKENKDANERIQLSNCGWERKRIVQYYINSQHLERSMKLRKTCTYSSCIYFINLKEITLKTIYSIYNPDGLNRILSYLNFN